MYGEFLTPFAVRVSKISGGVNWRMLGRFFDATYSVKRLDEQAPRWRHT